MALDLQKLSNKSNLKRSRASLKQETVYRDNHSQNIWDKLYFSCEIAHYGKSLISVFQEIFTSFIDKILISEEGLSTRQ